MWKVIMIMLVLYPDIKLFSQAQNSVAKAPGIDSAALVFKGSYLIINKKKYYKIFYTINHTNPFKGEINKYSCYLLLMKKKINKMKRKHNFNQAHCSEYFKIDSNNKLLYCLTCGIKMDSPNLKAEKNLQLKVL